MHRKYDNTWQLFHSFRATAAPHLLFLKDPLHSTRTYKVSYHANVREKLIFMIKAAIWIWMTCSSLNRSQRIIIILVHALLIHIRAALNILNFWIDIILLAEVRMEHIFPWILSMHNIISFCGLSLNHKISSYVLIHHPWWCSRTYSSHHRKARNQEEVKFPHNINLN
jgi:hypothetical protein